MTALDPARRPGEFVFDSTLEQVGLTALFARVLADAGISCNVLAGRRHDHLLVPADRADEAIALLRTVDW